MSKRIYMLLCLSFFLVLVGCSKDESLLAEEEPDTIHDSFIYFVEEFTDENYNSIGSLYIQKEGKEAEKIASGVNGSQVYYENKEDEVLFLNENNDLFVSESGKDNVKLAENVSRFDEMHNQGYITYQNDTQDLYVVKEEQAAEKIASEVYDYELIDETFYYVDMDGDLTRYNSETSEQKRLANDVAEFYLTNREGSMVYVSNDNMLYYRPVEGESIRISNDSVNPYSIQLLRDRVIYLQQDGDSENLYISDLAENGSKTKVATDVYYVVYNNDYFYYLNEDNNLFKKTMDDDSAIKLASDVNQFEIVDGTIYYFDKDQVLQKLDKEGNAERISDSIVRYDITQDGEIIYLNQDDELFIKNKKVATDIDRYAYYFGHVAYATKDDQLFLSKDLGEPKELDAELDSYTRAFYQNQLVYENLLRISDVSGVWRFDEEQGTKFIEIEANGNITNLFDDSSNKMHVELATVDSVEVDVDGSYWTITRQDKDTIVVNRNNEELTFTKSSKKEFEDVLSFADVSGVWKYDDGYGIEFIKLDAKGNFESLLGEQSVVMEMQSANNHSMEVEMDGHSATITKNDEKTLVFERSYEEITFTKSSEKEAEEFVQSARLKADKAEIDDLIESYLNAYIYAVNYGDKEYLQSYIDSESDFYNQQVDYSQSLYEKDIYEELLEHRIERVDSIDANTYQVTVYEKIRVVNPEAESDETSEYNNTYVIKRVQGELLLTSIDVSVI